MRKGRLGAVVLEQQACEEVKENKEAIEADLNGARCSSLVAVGRRGLQ